MKERGFLRRILDPRVRLTQQHPDSDLDRQLQACYESVACMPGFPYDKCRGVSKIVANRTGLQIVDGIFRVDIPHGSVGTERPHAWCLDQEERIVDLTAAQFNPLLRRHSRIPKGVIVVKPQEVFSARYTKLRE